MAYLEGENHTGEDLYRFHKESPFDKAYDIILSYLGVNPEALSTWLREHPRESRIIADSISILRLGLGYLAIRKYKKALEAGDKKGMLLSTVSMAALLLSDSVDGYIARKAGIQEGQHGKIVDAVSDGVLKAMIAKTLIFDGKKGTPVIDKVRTASDLFLSINGMREIFRGEYQTTDFGKVKMGLDVTTVLAEMAGPQVVDKYPGVNESLEILTVGTRFAATILSIRDGYEHFRNWVRGRPATSPEI